MASLTRLTKLDLTANQLQIFPAVLCSLPKLDELNLSHNQIECVCP